MADLVPFSGEPRDVAFGHDRIQQHQTLHSSSQGRRSPVPILGLSDRGVERFVMNVKEAAPDRARTSAAWRILATRGP